MSFRRTDSGLSTMHRFLGVDAVVFVEGGASSFTLEEIYAGRYSAQADDLKYWQIVFSTFAATRSVHLRSVGSKKTIREIAALIVCGKVTHVLAAMDRDLDHLNASLPLGAGTFHTLGYSWENDVWTGEVVLSAFRRFSNVPEAEGPASKEIRAHFARARQKLRHCVRVDAMLAAKGLRPLRREKFRRLLRPLKSHPPGFSRSAARALVKEASVRVRPQRLTGGPTHDTLRDCDGHLLGAFGYHLLVHVLRKYCQFRVTPKDLLVPAAIDAFAAALASNPLLTPHYSRQFAPVKWA